MGTNRHGSMPELYAAYTHARAELCRHGRYVGKSRRHPWLSSFYLVCVSVFVGIYIFCLFVCLVCLLVYTERIMPLGRAPLPGISFGILCLPVCGNIARRWCHRVEPLACHHWARPPQDASQVSKSPKSPELPNLNFNLTSEDLTGPTTQVARYSRYSFNFLITF